MAEEGEEYIWAQERVELVQLAAANDLEALGLSVPRGEPCPEVENLPLPNFFELSYL